LALEADICGARFGRAPVAYRGTAPKRGIPFSGLQVVCPRVRERSPVALYGGHQFVRVEHVHVKDGGRPKEHVQRIVRKIDILFAEYWKALQYSDTIALLVLRECCFVGVEYDGSRSRVIAGNWQ
jgi:hypothetical protein